MTKKNIPTVLAWALLVCIGVWFIFFATYHSENVAKNVEYNSGRVDTIIKTVETIVNNQSEILKNQKEKKELLDKQEKEVREILEVLKKHGLK